MLPRSPSTYLWEDETGNVQDIPQGEGGEQGDPFMPLLFSLGLHGALNAVKARLSEGEKVFAFFDVHVICARERVLDVYKILEDHTHIRMHHGKTRECDSSGRGDIDKGGPIDPTRSLERRWSAIVPLGNKILGIPVGQPECVRQFLEEGRRAPHTLPTHMVEDPQAAWLFLFMRASPEPICG